MTATVSLVAAHNNLSDQRARLGVCAPRLTPGLSAPSRPQTPLASLEAWLSGRGRRSVSTKRLLTLSVAGRESSAKGETAVPGRPGGGRHRARGPISGAKEPRAAGVRWRREPPGSSVNRASPEGEPQVIPAWPQASAWDRGWRPQQPRRGAQHLRGRRCCWRCGNTQRWRCSPKWKPPWWKSPTPPSCPAEGTEPSGRPRPLAPWEMESSAGEAKGSVRRGTRAEKCRFTRSEPTQALYPPRGSRALRIPDTASSV